MEERDDIGTLFKNAFEGHRSPPEDTAWETLNHSLGKRNFFRFNPYQFNIYYASSILVCLFVCLVVGTHYTYRHWQGKDEQTVHLLPSSKFADDTSVLDEKKIGPINDHFQKREMKEEERNKDFSSKNVAPLQIVAKHSETGKVDSNQIISHPAKSEVLSRTDSAHPPKHTLYITKRDTIFKVDTIKTHKKQKRWF